MWKGERERKRKGERGEGQEESEGDREGEREEGQEENEGYGRDRMRDVGKEDI